MILTDQRPSQQADSAAGAPHLRQAFEIEEHFRDIKWIEHYEWHQMKKLDTARTVFMFVFLGWWLLLKAYGAAADHQQTRKTHPKKQLSWFRAIWEYWQRLRSLPVFGTS